MRLLVESRALLLLLQPGAIWQGLCILNIGKRSHVYTLPVAPGMAVAVTATSTEGMPDCSCLLCT